MNIVLTNPVFYSNGTSGASGVVGYESRHNRVARYNLASPDIGANKIDLSFIGNWEGAGTLPNTLYFYVGTDPNDHANAGSTSAKTGELTRKSGTYEYYGSADILLMPNTTYYVWVFPSSTTFGWLYWGKNTGDASVETYGGAISTVATGSATLGQTVSLKVTKYVSDYTHTIKYTIGGQSGTICTKSSATSVPWTPSIDLAWQIKSAEQGAANLTVETYRGNTLIGTMQGIKFNLIVPASIVPSVSATFEDSSKGYSVFGVHVQNVSYFRITPTSNGAYGSTIQKTEMLLNGETYSGGIVAESGTVELSVVVTDSRGRTATWVTNVEVAEYSYPTASVSASRCDEDGTLNETGEFANVTISAKTFNVNGRNEANATLNYGQQTQSIQVPIGTRDVSVIVPAPSVSAMQISASVTDRLGSSALAVMTLSVGYATLDFLAGGKGIAFGTTAKEPGFTCAMNANFTGSVQIAGGSVADVVVEQGTSGIWYYRKWNSGVCELYGRTDAIYTNAYSMGWSANFPFTLVKIYSAQATCNYAAGGSNNWTYGWNAKAEVTTTTCKVWVQSASNDFGESNGFVASATVVGTWK